jgi:predicted nucleotidyltransferase
MTIMKLTAHAPNTVTGFTSPVSATGPALDWPSVADLNEASRWRLRLARLAATAYTSDPGVAAVAVAGSTARGCADRHSDVELAVWWHEAPAADRRRQAAERMPEMAARRDFGYDVSLDAWSEDCTVLGVKVDVGHRTVTGFESILAAIAEGHDGSNALQHVAAELLVAIPLHGADLLGVWRRRVEPYPEALAISSVESQLRFGPHAWLVRLVERDDVLALAEIRVAAARSVLGVLLGLNRTYHPGHKWIARTIDAMAIRPPDLHARFRLVLTGPPDRAVHELGLLIDDTIGLVEQHLPQIDTARVRARVRTRTATWERPPPSVPTAG